MKYVEFTPPVVKVLYIAKEKGFSGSGDGNNESIGAPGWK